MGRELVKYTKDGKEITFKYDENGLRHRKTISENGAITEQYDYVWSDGVLISQTYFDIEDDKTVFTASAKFIYDSWGTLQGFILNNSETYLYVKNLQGDIIAIVDEKGQVIVEYSYDAWGNVTFSESSLQNMSKASTLCFVSPFTYRGYCYDYDIELYYLQSRYYSAEIGRFINADSTDYLGATGTVLSFNLFSYCENNPVMNVDYMGNFTWKIYMVAAIVSALMGAASKIIYNFSCGYRGKNLFKNVFGSAIGSAINTVLLMKFIRQGKKGLVIAALVASFAQVIIDYIESVFRKERQSFRQLTFNFVLNAASNYIGNYIGYKAIKIDGNWFQPQKVLSFFTKSYGQRIMAQTGLGAVANIAISKIVDAIKWVYNKCFKK